MPSFVTVYSATSGMVRSTSSARLRMTRSVPKVYGTDLVIRNLADDVERTIPDVAEYNVTKDGRMLVYAVASKKE